MGKGCVTLQRNVPHKKRKILNQFPVFSLPFFLCNAVMPSFFQHIGQLQIVKLNWDYIYKENPAILYLGRQVTFFQTNFINFYPIKIQIKFSLKMKPLNPR